MSTNLILNERKEKRRISWLKSPSSKDGIKDDGVLIRYKIDRTHLPRPKPTFSLLVLLLLIFCTLTMSELVKP